MSENRNESNQDAVKQLGSYKSGKLAELRNRVSEQKTRAIALMAAIRAKREALIAKAEEEKRIEEERAAREEAARKSDAVKSVADESVREEVTETTEPSAEPVATPSAEPVNAQPEIETSDSVVAETSEITKKKAETVPEKSAEEADKEQSESAQAVAPQPIQKEEKPKIIKQTTTSSGASVQSELLPNGEIRRIYIPPEPQKKEKVTTRVFAGGFQGGRRPRGAPQPSGHASPPPQGG